MAMFTKSNEPQGGVRIFAATRLKTGTPLKLSQSIAQHFTRSTFGQLGKELNPPGIFIGSDPLLHELLELTDDFRRSGNAVFQNHEGLRGVEFRLFFESYDCRFENGFVFNQRALDFGRRNPLARNSKTSPSARPAYQ